MKPETMMARRMTEARAALEKRLNDDDVATGEARKPDRASASVRRPARSEPAGDSVRAKQ